MEAAVTIETEKSIIGSILVHERLMLRILGTLKPDDFSHPVSRYIFSVMEELSGRGLDVNIITVENTIRSKGNDMVNREVLESYLDYAVDAPHALDFVQQVSETSGVRSITRDLEILSKEISANKSNLNGYIERLTTILTVASRKGMTASEKFGDVLYQEFLENLGLSRANFAMTGVERIDKDIIDIAAGKVTIWAARPSVGKTAMLLQSMDVNISRGYKVGMLSLEMPSTDLVNRLVSRRTQVDGLRIMRMQPEELLSDADLKEALEYYSFCGKLFVEDEGPWDINSICNKMRKLVLERGVDIIYLDYIQLIEAAGENRQQEITKISRRLKLTASELGIPLIVASQLNRSVENSINSEPGMAHLRESGSLEQDANIINFLYPDTTAMGVVDEEQVQKFLKAQQEIPVKYKRAKQRNGIQFHYETLIFKKNTGTFVAKSDAHSTYPTENSKKSPWED